jgi:hypothetical protein
MIRAYVIQALGCNSDDIITPDHHHHARCDMEGRIAMPGVQKAESKE